MPKTFKFSKSIESSLGQRVVDGETIPFSTGDLEVVFDTWESLTVAQQSAIITEMLSRGLEAVD